jgi:tetratricopeptide (TPR) repeat protein
MLRATAHMAKHLQFAMEADCGETHAKAFAGRLTEWIDFEIKELDQRVKQRNFNTEAYDKMHLLLTEPVGDSVKIRKGAFEKEVVAQWKNEIQNGLAEDLPELLTAYLKNGWVTLEGIQLDWFRISSYWFAQLLAKTPLAEAKFQNKLLAHVTTGIEELNNKADQLLELLKSSIPNSGYIEKEWGEIKQRLDRIESKIDRIIAVYEKRVEALELEIKQLRNNSSTNDSSILKLIGQLTSEKDMLQAKLADKENFVLQLEQNIEDLEKQLKANDEELKQKAANALSEGRLDEAEALLLASVEKRNKLIEEETKKEAEDCYQLGKLYEIKLKYRQALEYYKKAAALVGDNVDYLGKAGGLSRDLGYLDNATSYFDIAITLAVEKITLSRLYNELGSTWDLKGAYDKAIGYYEQALDIDKKNYGDSHPIIAIRYNNIGSSWSSKGAYDKAIRYLEQGLVIDKEYYGESHPQIAIRYNNLGLAWRSKGAYDKAIAYYEQALTIDTEYYGESHPKIATRYNNLGNVWYAKGDYGKSITYHELALVIDKEYYGESHPDIAIDYNNLGTVLRSKGENDKAIAYYEQALAIGKEYYGESHPKLAVIYNNLGIAWRSKGAYDRAILYYKQALTIDIEYYGENHPDIAIDYNNLGSVLYAKSEYDKAIGYLELAYKIYQEFLGDTHPSTQTVKENLKICIDTQNERK